MQEAERRFERPGLSDPSMILNGVGHAPAVERIARDYAGSGVSVAAANTFGLRSLLHRGEEATFDRAVDSHVETIRRACPQAVHRALSWGPAYDCYSPDQAPTTSEARDFHGRPAYLAHQYEAIAWFETVNTIDEAVGIAQAAKKAKATVTISFAINHNSQLLSGESLRDAIFAVDAATNNYPIGFSINCCPIEALEPALKSLGKKVDRIIGIYPNASSLPPHILNNLALSDRVAGLVDPDGVAKYLSYLAHKYHIRIVGGCCGHDHNSIQRIAEAVRGGVVQSEVPATDLSQYNHHIP